MNQQKIGAFLKELRNEKNLTQEQLSEQFNVSSRTISRWETGKNMPDLSIIVELSDFYNVDIRELLNGERDTTNMSNEPKETIQKISEYSSLEKTEKTKKINSYFILSIISIMLVILNNRYGLLGFIFVPPIDDFIAGMLTSLCIVFLLVGFYNNNNDTTLRDRKLSKLSHKK